MISFTELLPRLVNVTKLTERDLEYDCPRCGGRATVKSFGRGWSAKCPQCGNLGENDFTARATSADQVPGEAESPIETGTSRRAPASINAPASSAAQPAHKAGDAIEGQLRPSRVDTTASVGEADADAGIQASEEVGEHRRRDDTTSRHNPDNAAPAAGLNGAGGGRPYRPNFTHRDTTAEDYEAASNGVPEMSLVQWRASLMGTATRLLVMPEDKGGYNKATAARDLLEPLIGDMIRGIDVLRGMGTHPPSDLSESDLREECEAVARNAIEGWLGSSIWSVPGIQNGNGAVNLLELPDLSRKEIEPLKWSQMRQRRAAQQREWIVEGLLARGEMSSWAGKVEAGKTTLMRELTLCVVRGEPFLGRPTQQGKVAYLMLDADGEEETYDEFDKLGFNDEDGENTLFIFEPMLAQIDHGLEKLVKMLLDFGPTLAVIDPYPRLKKIEDFSGYENTYLMGELSHVARLVRAHFALPGHIPRGRDDDADVATAGFGSISFSGGVNARFIVTNRKGTHTIRSSKGKGSSFKAFDAEYVTQQDEITNRIELGAPWSWKDKARSYMEVVQQFLDSHEDRPFDVVTLAKEIRAQKSVLRTAANMLFGKQAIRREGEGLKSAPFIYASLAYHGKLTMEEVKRD